MTKVIAICGKSASGKDSLAKKIVSLANSDDVGRIITDTSRPPRTGEQNGIDYNFVNIHGICYNDYIEFTNFLHWFYGTNKKALKYDINVGVFNPQGMLSLYKYCAENDIEFYPVVLKANIFKRLYRSYKREKEWKIEFLRRAAADFKDFLEFKPDWKLIEYRSDNLDKIAFDLLGKIE